MYCQRKSTLSTGRDTRLYPSQLYGLPELQLHTQLYLHPRRLEVASPVPVLQMAEVKRHGRLGANERTEMAAKGGKPQG